MVIDYRSINYKLLKQNKSVYIPMLYILNMGLWNACSVYL